MGTATQINDPLARLQMVRSQDIGDSIVTFSDRARVSVFAAEGDRVEFLQRVLGYEVAKDSSGELLIRRKGSTEKFGYFDDPRFRFSGREILYDLVADNTRDFVTSGLEAVKTPLLLALGATAAATGGGSLAAGTAVGSLSDGLMEVGIQTFGFLGRELNGFQGADLGFAFGFGALGALIPGAGSLMRGRCISFLKERPWGRELLAQMGKLGDSLVKELNQRFAPIRDQIKSGAADLLQQVQRISSEIWDTIKSILVKVKETLAKVLDGISKNVKEIIDSFSAPSFGPQLAFAGGVPDNFVAGNTVVGKAKTKNKPSNVVFMEAQEATSSGSNASGMFRKIKPEEKIDIRTEILMLNREQLERYAERKSKETGLSPHQISGLGAFFKIYGDRVIKENELKIPLDDLKTVYGLLLSERQKKIGGLGKVSVEELKDLGDERVSAIAEKLAPALETYDILLSGRDPKKLAKSASDAAGKVVTDTVAPASDKTRKLARMSAAAAANYQNPVKIAWNGQQEDFVASAIRLNHQIALGNVLSLTGRDPTRVVEMYARAGVPARQIFAVESDRAAWPIFRDAAEKLAKDGKEINFYFGSLEDVLARHPRVSFQNVHGGVAPPTTFSVFDLDFPGYWTDNKHEVLANAATRWSDPKGSVAMVNLLAARENQNVLSEYSGIGEILEHRVASLRNRSVHLQHVTEGLNNSLANTDDRQKTMLHWTTYFSLYSGTPHPSIASHLTADGYVSPDKVRKMVDKTTELFDRRLPLFPSGSEDYLRPRMKEVAQNWNQHVGSTMANMAAESALSIQHVQSLRRLKYISPINNGNSPFLSVFIQVAPDNHSPSRALREAQGFLRDALNDSLSSRVPGFQLTSADGRKVILTTNNMAGGSAFVSKHGNELSMDSRLWYLKVGDGNKAIRSASSVALRDLKNGGEEWMGISRERFPLDFIANQLSVPLVEVTAR